MSHDVQSMTIALENGQRVSIEDVPDSLEERKGHEYTCPCCGARVIARKGEVRVHHFAHAKGERQCDSWQGYMTDWHANWQAAFPKDSREVVFEGTDEENKAHRADVFLPYRNVVVEFQHSPMSRREFLLRSRFYTRDENDCFWLFDFRDKAARSLFDDHMPSSFEPDSRIRGCWRWPPAWIKDEDGEIADVSEMREQGIYVFVAVTGDGSGANGFVLEMTSLEHDGDYARYTAIVRDAQAWAKSILDGTTTSHTMRNIRAQAENGLAKSFPAGNVAASLPRICRRAGVARTDIRWERGKPEPISEFERALHSENGWLEFLPYCDYKEVKPARDFAVTKAELLAKYDVPYVRLELAHGKRTSSVLVVLTADSSTMLSDDLTAELAGIDEKPWKQCESVLVLDINDISTDKPDLLENVIASTGKASWRWNRAAAQCLKDDHRVVFQSWDKGLSIAGREISSRSRMEDEARGFLGGDKPPRNEYERTYCPVIRVGKAYIRECSDVPLRNSSKLPDYIDFWVEREDSGDDGDSKADSGNGVDDIEGYIESVANAFLAALKEYNKREDVKLERLREEAEAQMAAEEAKRRERAKKLDEDMKKKVADAASNPRKPSGSANMPSKPRKDGVVQRHRNPFSPTNRGTLTFKLVKKGEDTYINIKNDTLNETPVKLYKTTGYSAARLLVSIPFNWCEKYNCRYDIEIDLGGRESMAAELAQALTEDLNESADAERPVCPHCEQWMLEHVIWTSNGDGSFSGTIDGGLFGD